jgi:hypothetical protein
MGICRAGCVYDEGLRRWEERMIVADGLPEKRLRLR